MIVTNKRAYAGSGASIGLSAPKEHDGVVILGPITIPKGKVSTAFTHSSNTTGTITLPAGHGLATGYFDLYWDGGSSYSVSVTVSVNTMTILGGFGNNLPPTSTQIVIAPLISIKGCFGWDDIQFAAFQFTGHTTPDKCRLTTLVVGESTGVHDSILADGGELVVRDIENGDTNPFENILENLIDDGSVYVRNSYLSNGSSVSDALFRMIGSYNL